MLIKNIEDLIEGKEYWHLYITYSCHWEIKVKCDKYKIKGNWENMIVFDNENEANNLAEKLHKLLKQYIIT